MKRAFQPPRFHNKTRTDPATQLLIKIKPFPLVYFFFFLLSPLSLFGFLFSSLFFLSLPFWCPHFLPQFIFSFSFEFSQPSSRSVSTVRFSLRTYRCVFKPPTPFFMQLHVADAELERGTRHGPGRVGFVKNLTRSYTSWSSWRLGVKMKLSGTSECLKVYTHTQPMFSAIVFSWLMSMKPFCIYIGLCFSEWNWIAITGTLL